MPVAPPAVTPPAPKVDVRADAVALYPFYAGTTLLDAHGHVVVRAGTRTLTADAVRYDLNANRLVAAGHVRVASPDPTAGFDAVACAIDFARGTTAYERLDPEPATFAFRGTSASAAVEGPADAATFAVADVSGGAPYVRGRHAYVVPGANVRFSPAIFSTGAGPPAQIPTFLYTFARTNFSQNSLPGASFDQPFPLFGTAASLTQGHLRYDPVNDGSIALDERLVQGNTAYASASWIPLRGQRADIDAFSQLRRGVTQTFSGFYLYGPQHDEYGTYTVQWTSPSTRTIFNVNQFDTSNHASLTLSSIDHFIPPLATYRVQASYDYDHEPGALPFANAFSIATYGYAASPSVKLPLAVAATLRYDFNLQQYDFPHQTQRSLRRRAIPRPARPRRTVLRARRHAVSRLLRVRRRQYVSHLFLADDVASARRRK
jgi:hypothetical protein